MAFFTLSPISPANDVLKSGFREALNERFLCTTTTASEATVIAGENPSSVFEQEPTLRQKLLSLTRSSAILHEEHVQSLWSGYGQISRITLDSGVSEERCENSVIVKFISPPAVHKHPRGWNTDISRDRKIGSYQIEANWYRQFATDSQHPCAMPAYIASHHDGDSIWLIIEDLNIRYPIRHQYLSIEQCKPCLRWLARFHALHMHKSTAGLWPTGTYWHLQTRQDEFDAMKAGKLKEAAEKINQKLDAAQNMTIVHGDAKVANFCFSENSSEVAAVDFQYTGGGCGIKDVAYFLGSALSDEQCQQYAESLLDDYFYELKVHLPSSEFESLELEWRELYCFAWADFHRFLAGWMPEHEKINNYSDSMTSQALSKLQG